MGGGGGGGEGGRRYGRDCFEEVGLIRSAAKREVGLTPPAYREDEVRDLEYAKWGVWKKAQRRHGGKVTMTDV